MGIWTVSREMVRVSSHGLKINEWERGFVFSPSLFSRSFYLRKEAGKRTLMARIRNTILQRIRREQTHFDLDSRNGMHGVRSTDRVRVGLAQPDSTDLPFFDQVRQRLDRGLDRDIGVDARALEDVDCLDAGGKNSDGFLNRGSDTLWTAIGAFFHLEGAFDAEHDFAGVFGILFKVVLEQM